MVCKNCSLKPVIELTNNNVKLCKSCFVKYFEKKAFRTISKYELIDSKDVIGVAVSGGKDSFTVLNIINLLANKKRDIKVKVIAIDEGIQNYRDLSLLKKYCKENNLDLNIYSFKKEFGMPLDIIKDKIHLKPCSACGVLRRLLLNSKARELKVDKLATGHNLDDEAQNVLMNLFRGNLERSARLGPTTGIRKYKRFIPRIKPLYFLTEKEVATYSFIKKFPVDYNECPNSKKSYRSEVRMLLNNFEQKQNGTKHAIINSFIEELPLLKKKFENSEIKSCKNCGEPCSSDICKACELIETIKTKPLKKI
jgi:uncharacterized protein (TIGR00269 family)